MDTITTILIWLGSGFAFAIGMVLGVLLMRKGQNTECNDLLKGQYELMRERNRLDEQKVRFLDCIADHLETIAAK